MSYMDWPFAQNGQNAIPQTINYDLVIAEPYPGIVFEPTNIAGSAYQEIREVNGCIWIVTNAMWNPNTTQWEQDSPTNCALPAYALRQCETGGTLTRLVADPTNMIGTPVVWIPVWVIDSLGNMTVEPRAATASDQVAEQVNPTWDSGSLTQMVARQVNVTDIASDTTSYLDELTVNGTPKWAVDKEGVLRIGTVPSGLISPSPISAVEAGLGMSISTSGGVALVSVGHGDYVDLPNAQTITGVKTLTDVAGLLLGAATGAQGSVTAGPYGTALAFGAKFSVVPFTWQAEATSAAIICVSTAGTTENPDGFDFYYDTGLTPGNTYNPTLVFSINALGEITTGTFSALELAGSFEGTGGIVVSYDGVTDKVDINGSNLLMTIISTDGSILATLSPAQTYDLSVATAAVAIGATIPYSGNGGNPTAVLPNYGAWFIKLTYGLSQTTVGGTNTNLTITLTPSNISSWGSNCNDAEAWNAVGWITLFGTGTAVSGATVGATISITGGSIAEPPYTPWLIEAIRTA